MSRFKFRTWDKKLELMEQYHYLQLAPSGQLYHNGMNVTDNYEIMQYTGLKDKNGIEIYEGDILKGPTLYETPENTATTYSHWEVTFGDCSFLLGGDSMEEDVDWISDECEVVGNIYENLELLKGDEE